MCGCLCRIGSDAIFGPVAKIEDPGEIINQAFFSNMLGSFILGRFVVYNCSFFVTLPTYLNTVMHLCVVIVVQRTQQVV